MGPGNKCNSNRPPLSSQIQHIAYGRLKNTAFIQPESLLTSIAKQWREVARFLAMVEVAGASLSFYFFFCYLERNIFPPHNFLIALSFLLDFSTFLWFPIKI
jgi:hypothetical protein